MAVPPIFRDDVQQNLFEKQGFVILPFLTLDQLTELRSLFEELHPNLPQGGFVTGSAAADLPYRKEASNKLVNLFRPSFDTFFKDYQSFGASFLFKFPNNESEVGVHQDWSIVDEDKHVAINIWVPLDDIHADNGPLMLLPGSQYSKHKVHRAPTLDFFFRGNEKIIIDKLKPFYIKAGEAIVLNQSLIHYSPTNTSGKLRRSVTAGIKTKGAPMKFYYKPDRQSDLTEVFEMDEDFLIKFENFQRDIFLQPKHGELKEKIKYEVPVYDDVTLDNLAKQLMERAGYKAKRKSIFNRLFSRLNGSAS
ncbi:MAG: phytanoyl-CoA dioxygenase family protein [Chitinophagales bacterium]